MEDQSIVVALGTSLPDEREATAYQLTPESSFFRELLDIAMAAQPGGAARLTEEAVPVDPPA